MLVVVEDPMYFADLELYEAASTLDYLVWRDGRRTTPYPARPKIGARYLPHNMSPELRADAEFWAKVGAEEILHYFGVPEHHDPGCFFHPEGLGRVILEDARKEYCPR